MARSAALVDRPRTSQKYNSFVQRYRWALVDAEWGRAAATAEEIAAFLEDSPDQEWAARWRTVAEACWRKAEAERA